MKPPKKPAEPGGKLHGVTAQKIRPLHDQHDCELAEKCSHRVAASPGRDGDLSPPHNHARHVGSPESRHSCMSRLVGRAPRLCAVLCQQISTKLGLMLCDHLSVTPCSLLDEYQCFGGRYYLHVQRTQILKLLKLLYLPTRLHGVIEHHKMNLHRRETPKSKLARLSKLEIKIALNWKI
jgi:hypothetical protein